VSKKVADNRGIEGLVYLDELRRKYFRQYVREFV
jgi:hypothetical protein